MSGKSYTMKELKMIVDYIVEHKVYSETKGRKMWMDFANSQLTVRTWQSLKQTFLKRVLPDIHNPYYKLTMDQIRSFSEGCDVEKKLNNKLEIQTISDESSTNAENAGDIEQPSTSNNNEGEKTSGEGTHLKIPSCNRSSTETLVLENCLRSEEEEEALESPNKVTSSDPSSVKNPSSTKSVRDLITYSEPLTPMLQEVLDDFVSESESNDSDKEPQMEIVDSVPDVITGDEINGDPDSKKDRDNDNIEVPSISPDKNLHESMEPESNTEKSNPKENSIDLTIEDAVALENGKESKETNKSETNNGKPDNSNAEQNTSLGKPSSNSSIPLTDSLPNNPEALNKKFVSEDIHKEDTTINIIPNKRKRLSSMEITLRCKEKKSKNDTVEPVNVNVKKNYNAEKLTNEGDKVSEIISNAAIEGNNKNIPSKMNSEAQLNKEKISTYNKEKLTPDTSQNKNLCLNNVSLYDERFSQLKYVSTDSSDSEKKKKTHSPVQNNEKVFIGNEVVVLKSNSDSETEQKAVQKKKVISHGEQKLRTDSALANVFGFSRGTASSRRRRVSYRKSGSQHSHTNTNIEAVLSDWSSESDTEFVSPPRGRRNRQTKKYLKPQSARIMSLDEDGGLFVVHGKKIYPLVKDGKVVKKYLTYLPDSESEEESYWKLKYVEEKKKTEQLTKLLDNAKENNNLKIREKSPVLPIATSCNVDKQKEYKESDNDKKISLIQQNKVEPQPEKTVKIKFTKNNEEVHLEGHWPHIHPVLEQVVQLFHKDEDQHIAMNKPQNETRKSSSGKSTPVIITPIDEELRERVDKMESEIFSEIENIENTREVKPDEEETNVTERKRTGKLRQSPTLDIAVPPQSPAKRLKTTKSSEKQEQQITEISDLVEDKNKALPKRKSARTQNKVLKEAVSNESKETVNSRKSKTAETNKPESDDEEIKYKFPTIRKSYSKVNTKVAKKVTQKTNKRYSRSSKLNISSDNTSMDSIDSTQDYQDSDVSPINICLRKKRRLSFSTLFRRKPRDFRRKSYPCLNYELSSESNKSIPQVPIRSMIFQNSTLSSDAYKSESYQLLLPQRTSRNKLHRIEEVSSVGEKIDINVQDISLSSPKTEMNRDKINVNVGVENSSNVSLPLSPEISVVENISISKNMIISDEGPSLNEIHFNDENENANPGKYVISKVDVSIPLMQQECGLEKGSMKQPNLLKKYTVNEFQLDEIVTDGLQDIPSISDSLGYKLQNLLLESAKKFDLNKQTIPNNTGKDSLMEVDTVPEVSKKTNTRKRCSTPRKKKTAKKSKQPAVEIVLEEHTQTCSHGGRKSCPPLITVSTEGTDTIISENNNIKKSVETGRRIKKDIIKVKISRPMNNNKRKLAKELDDSGSSPKIDSGLNETESGVFLQDVDDSADIDLIHNHSDTCLHTNECIGDSVEFLANSNSVISLNTTGENDDLPIRMHRISSEIFSNDAQDGTAFKCQNLGSSDTLYHTPVSEASPNSLITDDLSDEPPMQDPPTKWYLLSEEDTTNTNFLACQDTTNCVSVGANLQDIFPITCAVPNLSTITEMSENSRKPIIGMDADLRDDMNSISMFD